MRNAEQVQEAKDAWRQANKERWNETGKAWKKANPEAMRRFKLRKYGLTIEAYETLLARQGGRCAICECDTPKRMQRDFCVDHDHDTGRVRGLLCIKCNAGLGNFDDNPGLILAAERYVQSHRSPAPVRSPAGAGGQLLRVV